MRIWNAANAVIETGSNVVIEGCKTVNYSVKLANNKLSEILEQQEARIERNKPFLATYAEAEFRETIKEYTTRLKAVDQEDVDLFMAFHEECQRR